MSRVVGMFLVGLVLAAAPAAMAQGLGLGEEGAAVSMEGKGESFWGDKRAVEVLEVRKYRKEGRVEIGLLGGVIPNDPFFFYSSSGVRLSYFISEALAVGGALIVPNASETDLGQEVFNGFSNIDSRQNLKQNLLYHVNIIEWTPMYGKMAFYSMGPAHFDIGLSAGFGLLHTQAPVAKLTGDVDESSETEDTKALFTAGLGFRFFVNNWLVVRADVGQYFYQKPDELGGLSHPTMVSLGMSALLPTSSGGN